MKAVANEELNLKRLIAATIFAFILIGDAFAHDMENHDKGHMADAQMQTLHHIMPMYGQARAKINEALTKGDAATIKNETGNILATIPDLKKAKPHKGLDHIATFRKIASAFAGDVKKTAALVKAGDFAGAKDAFRMAQMHCDECHKKFRD